MITYPFNADDDYKVIYCLRISFAPCSFTRQTAAADATLLHARSISLNSPLHDLDCQPSGDEYDRWSPKQILHVDHFLYDSPQIYPTLIAGTNLTPQVVV